MNTNQKQPLIFYQVKIWCLFPGQKSQCTQIQLKIKTYKELNQEGILATFWEIWHIQIKKSFILYLYCDKRRDIPRNFLRAQTIFHSLSQLKSQYRHSHLVNNGPALAVAYSEVDIAVAVKCIASVEAVLAAILTWSQSNICSHSHQFNHPSLDPSIHHSSIDSSIHPSIPPSKIA